MRTPPRKGDSKTDVPFGISLTFLLVAFLDPKQMAWVAIFVQKNQNRQVQQKLQAQLLLLKSHLGGPEAPAG